MLSKFSSMSSVLFVHSASLCDVYLYGICSTHVFSILKKIRDIYLNSLFSQLLIQQNKTEYTNENFIYFKFLIRLTTAVKSYLI